jgi:DNA-binding MarR family transcriptional regulator
VASQIGDLSRLMRRSFDRYIRSTGLTYPQWRVIGVLSNAQGIRQAALAQRLDMQPISMARLVDRLEEAGWIERRPDPDDRRAVRLFLTRKTQPVLEEIRSVRGDFEEDVLAGITKAERKQLLQLLARVRSNLELLDPDVDSTGKSPKSE